MASLSSPSSQHHPADSLSLPLLSLVLLCSVVGVLVGCAVWYILLRVTCKRRPVINHLSRRKKFIPKPEKSQLLRLNDTDSIAASEDEEKHIETISIFKSSVSIAKITQKRCYGDDISLLGPLGKKFGMQNQQPRRRSSSARQAISTDDEVVSDRMIAAQLAESPCARLLSSKAPANPAEEPRKIVSSSVNLMNANTRPNRMWGPRSNVKSGSRMGRPPRTVTRTISFWKRTSMVALKYADGGVAGIENQGSYIRVQQSRARRLRIPVPNANVNEAAAAQTQVQVRGHGQRRRPLPQLPSLPPMTRPNVCMTKDSSVRTSVQDVVTDASKPAIRHNMNISTGQGRPLAQEPLNYYHHQRHSSLGSSVLLHTPNSAFTEESCGSGSEASPLDLGMDELRAAVGGGSVSGSYNAGPPGFEPVSAGSAGVIPAASTVIHTRDIRVGPDLGDPYIRVQKILERAYSRAVSFSAMEQVRDQERGKEREREKDLFFRQQ